MGWGEDGEPWREVWAFPILWKGCKEGELELGDLSGASSLARVDLLTRLTALVGGQTMPHKPCFVKIPRNFVYSILTVPCLPVPRFRGHSGLVG